MGIDNARRQEFERSIQNRIHSQRQRSPLTPPSTRLDNMSVSGASPFFFPKLEPVYGMEDVQGVYVDDGGPLFANSEDHTHYAEHSMSNHGY